VEDDPMSDENKPKPDNERAAPGPSETDATIEALQAALAAEAGNDAVDRLEAELAETRDKLLRAAAETENVRRRAEREREDVRKFAVARFAEDMLAVADNLARALEAVGEEARKDETVRGLADGVELTRRDLAAALERHGVRAIEAEGKRFDPNLHQAVYEIESDGAEPGTVLQVLRTGYTINERLLRPAMVGVARAPAKPAA
jgi:molecular chaperone GrpE